VIGEWGRLRPPALVVHGGAGPRTPAEIGAARQDAFRGAVRAALAIGWDRLAAGADAVTAAVEAVAALEDSGALNAGRGSVRTSVGTVEMDAAVMDGVGRAVGAVAGVTSVRNPVRAARAVLADERWVLLCGPDADRYAAVANCETVGWDWFGPGALSSAAEGPTGDTVGAVAVDRLGRTAAASSTGGVPGQIPGRVGDSPIPGAGLWADDRTAAVAGTGVGESFLRAAAAHHVHMVLRGAGRDPAGTALADACRAALAEVVAVGGHGGLIALTASGDHAVIATTPLMIRGSVSAERAPVVRLFADS
jgi:beta-aspartyl-peptidase (threonine type)